MCIDNVPRSMLCTSLSRTPSQQHSSVQQPMHKRPFGGVPRENRGLTRQFYCTLVGKRYTSTIARTPPLEISSVAKAGVGKKCTLDRVLIPLYVPHLVFAGVHRAVFATSILSHVVVNRCCLSFVRFQNKTAGGAMRRRSCCGVQSLARCWNRRLI